MISIVSGPAYVGKTYFMENKRERLLEIAQLESVDAKFFTSADWYDMRLWTDVMWEDGSKFGCIHIRLPSTQAAYMKKFKSVFILGVPYSEYKVRRGKRNMDIGKFPCEKLLETYRMWIDELNKYEIPYKFVEAIGDYEVLEEEEFFRMIK